MALYNTFKYGDGTKYTDPNKTYSYYGVVADPNEATTGGLAFINTQRISVRINVTTSGSAFIIQSIRPNVEDGGYYPANYDCPAGQENVQRVSLKFNHSHGTLFQIQQIRPIVEVRQQEPIG